MTEPDLIANIAPMAPMFGAELAKHRRALKLTQDQFGKLIGLNERSIRNIEAVEKPVMGKSVLIAIAVQWLYTERKYLEKRQ